MARILLVDDDAMIRDVLRITLERNGYEVFAAGDGSEALAAYETQHPDLVLMDILMPGREGLETISAIRTVDPKARIVAMSGGGRNHPLLYLELARRLGALDALAKPFSHDDLLAAVQRALSDPLPSL